MKQFYLLVLFYLLGISLALSQSLSDVDGNQYNTVTIGNQTWMSENLKTTRYQNGDVIGTTTTLDIRGEIEPKYQWAYDNDESNANIYGRLYTWNVVNDPRNVCPTGWHVPNYSEWSEMIDFLGGISYGGGKLKEAGTTHWLNPNTGATNESGFTALPAGARGTSEGFFKLGEVAIWWTSADAGGFYYNPQINYDGTSIFGYPGVTKGLGMSVRCLKDSEAPLTDITVNNVTANKSDPVEVPISVSELTAGDNIIAFQFDIDFDNAILEYTGTDLTSTLAEGGTVNVNTSVAGKLSVSYMNSTALVGAGDLIKLQFNSLVADTTSVSISNAYLNSTEVTDLINGVVIVKDVTPPTAAITYNDTENRCGDDLLITATFNEPMLESKDVKLSLTGGATLTEVSMTRVSATVYTYTYQVANSDGEVTVTLSNGTDLWSNDVVATPTSGSTFTITPISYGDVDDDGKILAYDAALTLQYSVGLDPLPTIDPSPWENWRVTTANVDGIGEVTANDAGMILQYSAGIISSFTGNSKKSATIADVSIEIVDKEIVFYSYGNLIGLNISVDNENQMLGAPEILAENFLSAKNIVGTAYKIGLCTMNPLMGGEVLMQIPYNSNGSITFDMIINTTQKSVTVDLATGLIDIENKVIGVYPNPVSDILNISGLSVKSVAKIYNSNGQLLLTKTLRCDKEGINVSILPSGMYILELNMGSEIMVKKFVKK